MLTLEVNGLSKTSLKGLRSNLIDIENALLKARKKCITKINKEGRTYMKKCVLGSINMDLSTGRLAGSIDYQVGEDWGRIYTDLYYAKYVEYGTRRDRRTELMQETIEVSRIGKVSGITIMVH